MTDFLHDSPAPEDKKLQEKIASIHYEYYVEEIESTALESVLNKLFQMVEQENNSGSA
ncbi:MAG: hypothetical protein WAO28_03305 [Candidatus Microsaccharimonas sp.]